MKVHGKRHENILDLVTVSFKIIEVEVTELEDRRLRVKDNILPRVCSIDAGGCALDDMTLFIDTRRIDFCPYAEVRSTFSQINLERRELLVNGGHKLSQTGLAHLLWYSGEDTGHELRAAVPDGRRGKHWPDCA